MSLMLTLAVAELARTALFYREILGLTLQPLTGVGGAPAGLLLRRGDAVVLFRETVRQQALHPLLFDHYQRHPHGVGLTLELTLPDLSPVLRAIDRHGLHPLYELEDGEHRRREVWLHDPDGYLLVLCEEGEEQGREK